MIFPLIYIILLLATVLRSYRKERRIKPVETAEEIIKPVEQIHEQDDPLPACFTIEWDLENGGSKIYTDES